MGVPSTGQDSTASLAGTNVKAEKSIAILQVSAITRKHKLIYIQLMPKEYTNLRFLLHLCMPFTAYEKVTLVTVLMVIFSLYAKYKTNNHVMLVKNFNLISL